MKQGVPEVDDFIKSLNTWQGEVSALRELLIHTSLTETFKWKQPCYTLNGKNVVIIGNFRNYCALSFFKGALLKTHEDMLIAPGENSRHTRQLQFHSVQEIEESQTAILEIVKEAIAIESSGAVIPQGTPSEIALPEELIHAFEKSADLRRSFESLTPGRQRAYLMHISGAKQSATRIARIEKVVPRIMAGYGLNDCICGLSKRMPSCDGSHKRQ